MFRILAFGMTMLLLLVNDECPMRKINNIRKQAMQHIKSRKTNKNVKTNTDASQLNDIDFAIMWAYSK